MWMAYPFLINLTVNQLNLQSSTLEPLSHREEVHERFRNEERGSDGDMKIWNSISPDRESLEKLFKRAFRSRACRKVLSWSEKLYLRAMLKACWVRIRSVLVLRILAPIVRKILRALGERFETPLAFDCRDDSVDECLIKGIISLRCRFSYMIVKEAAARISMIAKKWGNPKAETWPEDIGFLKYLTMMITNSGNFESFAISLSY